jgi:murein DD-endopeptidase MepM/ murein hydrolase activator NlpD
MKPPVDKPVITSPYGMRTLNGKRQFHDGIDFVSGDKSSNVYSILPGVVTLDYDHYDDGKRWSDPANSAGNYVIIKSNINGEDHFVRYLHLKENFVSENQKVEEGFLIGTYADVGFSFGAHLHLDMYNSRWVKIDPTPIINEIIGEQS